MSFLEPYLVYIKIGLVAALVAVVGGLYLRNRSLSTQRDQLKVALETAVTSNEAQTAAITHLRAQIEKNEALVAELSKSVSVISAKDRANRKKIAELEKDNADVRAYLDRAVPDALRSLLSDEGGDADGNGPATPAAGPAITLHAT